MTQLLIVIAIVVVANLISRGLYFRLDFTEDQRYTLSKATEDVLADLNEVITVQAYFTEELPAQLAYVRNDLRDMLIEYENLSGSNLVFEFINPNESDELKQEAMQNGVAPISINVIENDQRQQLQAFLGVVMKSGEQTEVIPLIQPEGAMEYDLTTAIKKISILDKPKVGVISGYGEASLNGLGQMAQQLSVLYDIEPFNIRDTSTVPVYYRSLIWIGPKDTIPAFEFAKLDRYLDQGGAIFLAHSSVAGDLQQSQLGVAPDIGIRSWVGSKGLSYGGEFVIDPNCASVTVQQRQGFFTINSQVNFPYFPRVANFADHPITGGLEGIILPFVNGFSPNSLDTTTTVTPLLFTSDRSGVVRPPSYVDIQKEWRETDFPSPQQMLAAVVENIGPGGGKLTVIGNDVFIVNGEGQQAQQLNPDNVNFASNAIDFMSDDTGLIDLRTKAVTTRPLESVEDSTKNLLKYGNVFAPILLILVYAFVRRQAKNRQRQKWTQGNYA